MTTKYIDTELEKERNTVDEMQEAVVAYREAIEKERTSYTYNCALRDIVTTKLQEMKQNLDANIDVTKMNTTRCVKSKYIDERLVELATNDQRLQNKFTQMQSG